MSTAMSELKLAAIDVKPGAALESQSGLSCCTPPALVEQVADQIAAFAETL